MLVLLFTDFMKRQISWREQLRQDPVEDSAFEWQERTISTAEAQGLKVLISQGTPATNHFTKDALTVSSRSLLHLSHFNMRQGKQQNCS